MVLHSREVANDIKINFGSGNHFKPNVLSETENEEEQTFWPT